ncbi:uncharacterized protein Dwil_GK10714 [Drosophila willistoni]|uniref:CAF1B/HIR1 beta-propeller domain-containing protein n=1 Tax=Drosophila willistoni TaxID=7260 RepID=B4MIQ2_DROWI|nr:chromatin assembly factor 1 subunit B [Drosophila willistoni]EDW71991.1 uncharacterized protein Dwil_GK10714 [Drosophila willistoni]
MKCKIPEISWHNRDPVLSVDIQYKGTGLQSSTICRLASGGTDAHVLIWYLNRRKGGEGDAVDSGGDGDVGLELAADLSRHQRAVNTVRWSPNGELLASGDDESVVFIWKQKAEHEVINIVDADGHGSQDKEVWLTLKVLRGHREDIYDLSWSPNSLFLVTGSVDNTAMMWDVHKGKSLAILDDHKGYVQGVAWDPCNQYIATMSTDRHLRIFDANTKRIIHRVSKSTLPVKENHEMHEKSVRLYHDGTLQTFFRRLSFTPDGKLLITPAGITDYDGVLKPTNTAYGFSRYDLSRPAYVLPFPKEYAVAVRCSPVLYRLRPYNEEKNPPIIKLPYRMIYAVATKNSVLFYDTQQQVPFGIVSNIHYTRLTDLTWSADGNVLIVSSTDGFCSLLTFEADELGERYEEMEVVLEAAFKSSENIPPLKKKKQKATRKPSADEPAQRKPLKEKMAAQNNIKEKENDIEDDNENDSSRQSFSSSSSSSPKAKQIDTKPADDKPKPIAIRRSPRKVSVTPTPIATRRSPRKTDEASSINIKRKASCEAEKTVQPPVVGLLDKQIISSEEKFESPEKKCRPATPIQVRRQPRTPGSSSTSNFPLTPQASNQSAAAAKQAAPIAIRRTPRVLIDFPAPVNAPVVVEEAMDAWPLDEGVAPLPKEIKKTEEKSLETAATPLALNEVTTEHTEDIRLVYEDTQEGEEKVGDDVATVVKTPLKAVAAVAATTAAATTPKPATPKNKTPRRVSLQTISTPKSKKKLLN